MAGPDYHFLLRIIRFTKCAEQRSSSMLVKVEGVGYLCWDPLYVDKP